MQENLLLLEKNKTRIMSKRILGLDLGTNSIGWALVNEAENTEEISSIIKLGVRVNPLTVDEMQNFEKTKKKSQTYPTQQFNDVTKKNRDTN